MKHMLSWVAFCWMLVVVPSWAANSEPNEIENGTEFIELNVSVDLKGIEQAIQRTNESLDGLALSLSEVAQNSDLTEEQKQNIDNTVTNINQLIDVSTRSVEKLPDAIEHSKQAVSTKTEQFLDDLQMRILIAIGAIVAALVVFIVAIFKLVLMPMQATVVGATQNIAEMAKTLQVTAKAVEACSVRQEKLAQQLDEKHAPQ